MSQSKILVIDDHPGFSEFLEDALSSEYSVFTTASLEEGIDRLGIEPTPYDMVIADTNVGDQNTLAEFPRLVEAAEKAIIIGMSGREEYQAEWEALIKDKKAHTFLLKPITFTILLETVARLFKAAAAKSPTQTTSCICSFCGSEHALTECCQA